MEHRHKTPSTKAHMVPDHTFGDWEPRRTTPNIQLRLRCSLIYLKSWAKWVIITIIKCPRITTHRAVSNQESQRSSITMTTDTTMIPRKGKGNVKDEEDAGEDVIRRRKKVSLNGFSICLVVDVSSLTTRKRKKKMRILIRAGDFSLCLILLIHFFKF